MFMTAPYVNAAIAALWVMSAGAVGVLVPVTTPSGWFTLVALATTAPLIFMHHLKRPAQRVDQPVVSRSHTRPYGITP